jgi:hypothetical protein
MRYLCPVCGYPDLSENPRPPQGGGSYEICPSCRFQFGVTDDDRGWSFRGWREEWIEDGMPWRGVMPMPADWDARRQLNNVLDA